MLTPAHIAALRAAAFEPHGEPRPTIRAQSCLVRCHFAYRPPRGGHQAAACRDLVRLGLLEVWGGIFADPDDPRYAITTDGLAALRRAIGAPA